MYNSRSVSEISKDQCTIDYRQTECALTMVITKKLRSKLVVDNKNWCLGNFKGIAAILTKKIFLFLTHVSLLLSHPTLQIFFSQLSLSFRICNF